jgi:hypothetical protein
MSPYQNLLLRLDTFIRKYYTNILLRGILVFVIGCLASFLIVSLSEYFLYLPSWVKISVLSILGITTLTALTFWIIKPIIQILKIGKIISHEQAAIIIGEHFSEIKDQLLNILQLKKQQNSFESNELIEASIGQKIEKIALLPLNSAVNFNKNKKYLPYLLPLLLIIGIISFAAPHIFKEASKRLLQPTISFTKPAPFNFVVVNKNLEVLRNENYTLEVKLTGASIPNAVTLEVDDQSIQMVNKGNHTFEYTFNAVKEAIPFKLKAADYYSEKHILNVTQKPIITAVDVEINYPSYTSKKSEQKKQIGDISIPEGSTITWKLNTEHTNHALVLLGNIPVKTVDVNSNILNYSTNCKNDTTLSFILKNQKHKTEQRMDYKIHAIKDESPLLQIETHQDSSSGTQIAFNGSAADDYGISKVVFKYEIFDKNQKNTLTKATLLNQHTGKLVNFQYYFDVLSIEIPAGGHLNYFIEAWDNDGINGSKSTRSTVYTFKSLEGKELDEAINKNSNQISQSFSNSSKQTEQFNEDLKSLQSKLLNNSQNEWQKKQSIKELAQLQEQMKQNLTHLKNKFEEKIKQTEQKNYSEDIQEQQNTIKENLNEILNKDLDKQMKKLQDLMNQLQKEPTVDQLKQLQEENKLFNMDMERLDALMKQLEMQMKMEDLASKIEQIAKEQKQIKQSTEDSKANNQTTKKQQEDLRKELETALQKEFNDLKKLEQETKQNKQLEEQEKQGKDAAKNMKNSEQQLDQNQNDKAQESQEKANENLEKMAAALRNKSGNDDIEEIEMNIKAVRQILSNLIRLSFGQEQLLNAIKNTPSNQLKYIQHMTDQNALKGNVQIIRDSLFSLSKKMPKLSSKVNKEIAELDRNLKYSIVDLEKRNIQGAVTKQQYVMTHANNLALMLNEMLSNLIQQKGQQQKENNSGQCKNPGGSTPKPGAGKQLSDIISQQRSLSQKMQKQGEGKSGKEGKGEGKGEKGENGNQSKQQGNNGKDGKQSGGSDGNAQYLVELAQQQAAIRRQMAALSQKLNSQGNTSFAKELKQIQDQMDKNETDLVNRKIDATLIKRQQEILSRLLETEESLREQEEDDKRSSANPKAIVRPVPQELKPYLEEKKSFKEQFQAVPPTLKPFFKKMNNEYFNQVQ